MPQRRVVFAHEKDETFALPPPIVDLAPEDSLEPTGQSGGHVDSDDDSELDADEHDLARDATMVRSPSGTHWVRASRHFQLDTQYAIWYSNGQKMRKARSEKDFEESLHCVGTVGSVQDFWRYWNAIDIEKLADCSSLSVFKHPIKPRWEDDNNKEGGQWVVKCDDRCEGREFFTKLVLALIGGYFECHESLCGVVLSTKPRSMSLGLWNSKLDRHYVTPIGYELCELLGLENDCKHKVEHKEHQAAIKNGGGKAVQANGSGPDEVQPS